MIFLYGLLGSAVGSFLNVVIDRVPDRRSLLGPPSHCSHCGRMLAATDMVPVLSYLLLRGRCRSCNASIPKRTLWVELGTALLFAALWWMHGPSAQLLVSTVYGCFLLVILVIDLEHKVIPNVIILPAVALALGAVLVQPWLVPPPFSHYGLVALWLNGVDGWMVSTAQVTMLSQLLGGFLAFSIFTVIWLIAPQGMGAGDLKLAAFAGLIAAFPGAIVAVLGSFILGGVVSVVLLLSGIATRKTAIPFAPFLVITTFLVTVYGDPLLHWYLGY